MLYYSQHLKPFAIWIKEAYSNLFYSCACFVSATRPLTPLSGKQKRISLYLIRHQPPTTTQEKEGGWWSQPKIDSAQSSAPHTHTLFLGPAVPCSSVG